MAGLVARVISRLFRPWAGARQPAGPSPMKLLVGLGNPGSRYARNRHNVGFMAADAVLRENSFGPPRQRFRSETFEGMLAGEKVLLLKPQTFMNESGRAVGEAMRFFKLSPAEVVVFHDELDLAPGKVRVKTGGGHAGNNGIRSISQHIGADFVRVRIGIGHPGDKARVQGHVLSDFAKADEHWLEPLLRAIGGNADLLVAGEQASFLNRVHLAVAPPPRGSAPTSNEA